jgi:hypothetical protein
MDWIKLKDHGIYNQKIEIKAMAEMLKFILFYHIHNETILHWLDHQRSKSEFYFRFTHKNWRKLFQRNYRFYIKKVILTNRHAMIKKFEKIYWRGKEIVSIKTSFIFHINNFIQYFSFATRKILFSLIILILDPQAKMKSAQFSSFRIFKQILN